MLIIDNNRSIELNIIGYQFPETQSSNEEYNYDANWLICDITYSEDGYSKNYRDACLLTYELEDFVASLSKVIDGEEGGYISDFMEPYLQLSVAKSEDKVMFIVHFVYDNLDGIWKKVKAASFVEQNCALQILNELRELQKKYPQR